MKALNFCCHALSIGTAAAILAACGGNQSAAPQLPATSVRPHVIGTHMKAPSYTIIDIGTLGGTSSEAVGVNNRADVSGSSTLAGDTVWHAYYWHDGVMTDLGTLGGPNSFAPEEAPPNERGEIAGLSDTSKSDPYSDNFCGIFDFQPTSPYICRPFVWRHGSLTAFRTLGGPNGVAIGINSRGELVGTAETAVEPCAPPTAVFYPEGVIWGPQKDEMRKLRPLRGDNVSLAGAINDKGEAVGTSGTCALGGIEAVLWRHGTPINLGTLGGAVFNGAFGINNRSEVVGQSDLKGDKTHHAFLWRKGKMSDLGSILKLPVSLAAGINNKSQVVGFSQDLNSNNTVAWLWQNGTMTDLNTLIPPSSPWFFIEALGINDRGQIVGYAYNSVIGQVHAVLATPCNEAKHDRSCDEVRASKLRTVVLPQRVQRMLERLHPFNRLERWRR